MTGLGNISNNIPVPPQEAVTPIGSMISGEWYFLILLLMGVCIAALFIVFILIYIFGYPIIVSQKAKLKGAVIIEHFEDSRNGKFLPLFHSGQTLSSDGEKAGVILTTINGINVLNNQNVGLSYSLTGFTIPPLFAAACTKVTNEKIINLYEIDRLKDSIEDKTVFETNIFDKEAYNFNSFSDIVRKTEKNNCIGIDLTVIPNFVKNINQYYTEADVQKEVLSTTLNFKDGFGAIMMQTAIAIFIIAVAFYILG